MKTCQLVLQALVSLAVAQAQSISISTSVLPSDHSLTASCLTAITITQTETSTQLLINIVKITSVIATVDGDEAFNGTLPFKVSIISVPTTASGSTTTVTPTFTPPGISTTEVTYTQPAPAGFTPIRSSLPSASFVYPDQAGPNPISGNVARDVQVVARKQSLSTCSGRTSSSKKKTTSSKTLTTKCSTTKTTKIASIKSAAKTSSFRSSKTSIPTSSTTPSVVSSAAQTSIRGLCTSYVFTGPPTLTLTSTITTSVYAYSFPAEGGTILTGDDQLYQTNRTVAVVKTFTSTSFSKTVTAPSVTATAATTTTTVYAACATNNFADSAFLPLPDNVFRNATTLFILNYFKQSTRSSAYDCCVSSLLSNGSTWSYDGIRGGACLVAYEFDPPLGDPGMCFGQYCRENNCDTIFYGNDSAITVGNGPCGFAL